MTTATSPLGRPTAQLPASTPARELPRRVTTVLRHSALLTMRSVRTLMRQPAYLAISLVQPIIWLLLFGQLFRSVVEIPGFTSRSGNYLEFLTPGVILMTALFSSGWAGTVFIEDMNLGVMDRLLASPARRGALVIGSLVYQSITTVLQTLIVFGIAVVAGARFSGGVAGVSVTVLCAALVAVIVASLSDAIALLVRQQEALIGISQFIVLPLQFLSAAVMDTRLAPRWVQHVARYNPVDWAVVASRQALSRGTQWGAVWPRIGLLMVLAAVMAWLATRAFRTYQRSA
jgi:ABC-2 type transport system permease protein